ncbi:MAG: L,D-transpeptidase [Hyphomicrobiales bacterium]
MNFNKIAARRPSRRAFVLGSASILGLSLAGCTTASNDSAGSADTVSDSYRSMYGPLPSEKFPIPGVDLEKVPSQFRRRSVTYRTKEKPGTIIVDTSAHYLYLVEPGGKAMRYGVGLGRAGFEWSGRARVAWKRPWPTWTPPDEMIARRPDLRKYSADNGGMQPGLDNPLGARALYIFEGNKDTLYRIHGTPEYWTIGKSVSSGCVRMINQDVIDLYKRVRSNAEIVVV